jgi:hypothetical protein
MLLRVSTKTKEKNVTDQHDRSHVNGNGCSFANGNGKPWQLAGGWLDITMPPVHWWTRI